ncbi:MAG: hypothetical protein ACREJV_15310 [Candidatus Rokuibacteriota bacterium]
MSSGARRHRRRLWAGALVVTCALGVAGPVSAQGRLRRPPDPQELQLPRRAPLTLTPSITVEEEYNDNVLLNNDERRWDFITRFTPGIALEWESAVHRLAAAYSFSAELFARHPERSHAFERHDFFLDSLYRVNPQWTLTLSDTFTYDTDTNLIADEGISTGRDQAFGNILAGSASWLVEPQTTLRAGASWAVQRFDREDLFDSDVYRADLTAEHAFSRRFTGSLGYEFGYFDIERQENTTTHTPRLGVVYRFTETLTLRLSGGPTFEIAEGGPTHVVPAVSASLRQRAGWGTYGLDASQAVGIAGGLGGTTVNQAVGGFAQFTTLAKGLIVELVPRYSRVESHDDRIDVGSFSLPLVATYRVTSWLALVASYRFFHQRVDNTITSATGTPLASDVDQNRVAIGLQVGYPIRFE